jgi:Xaa-Pro aminopeptidase
MGVLENLIAVAKAYKEFKNCFEYGKTTDQLFENFKKSLDVSLGEYEIVYDYIWGKESLNIDGQTTGYYPKDGDTLIMDISVGKDGVWCDVCRTYFVGEITNAQLEIYEMIKRSIKAGEHVLKAGVKANELYSAVNGEYEKCGYSLVHHSGHQIETAPVEKPLFVASGNEILKDGFYTIESGLYKDFGMRLENDYFVDKNGATNLFENLMPLEAKEYILK